MSEPAYTFGSDVNQFPSLTWNHLHINRGHLEAAGSAEARFARSRLPDGIIFERKALSGLPLEAAGLETGMGKEFDSQFDGAMAAGGAEVNLYRVEDGKKLGGAVLLALENGGGVCDTLIVAGRGSTASFVLELGAQAADEAQADRMVGCRIRVVVREDAQVTLALVNLLDGDMLHFASVGARLHDRAGLEMTELQLGGSRVFSGSRYELSGAASRFEGRLAYLAGRGRTLDVNYVARQTGRGSSSSMKVNGVVCDTGEKTWRGTIDFVKGAVDAAGDEQEDVLLLGPGAVNKTLPVILCGEEAVDGRHGSTIGRIGSDTLFYMQSRGIDADFAKRLMVKSKIASVSRFVADAGTAKRIHSHLEGAFAG